MSRKFISYDLSNEDFYGNLYQCLEELNAIEANESFYVIRETSFSNEYIRDKIVNATTKDIKLIVGDMPVGVSTNFAKNFEKWKK